MVRISEFDPVHCCGARAHPSQARFQFMLDDPSALREFWEPEIFSALDGDELIAVGGSTLVDGMSGGWVLFTDRITPARFVVIHRTAVRFLVCFEQINDPIFVQVDPGNAQALRWAGLLGLETRRTDVLADGRVERRVPCHYQH